MKLSAPTGLEPLLAAHAVTRTGNDRIPGRFDRNLDVWIIDTPDGERPLVEAGRTLAELVTKTKVVDEQDDPASLCVLESVTKTFAQPEKDDKSSENLYSLLELATKTETA